MSMRSDMFIEGQQYEIPFDHEYYPLELRILPKPPQKLYLIGNPYALKSGLAIIGSRNATPYGISCTKKFAGIAAESGITIISGGARGCDATAHHSALQVKGNTVVFLGGGCNHIYPSCNKGLFQQIVNAGGAVVSEQPWDTVPRPYMFRMRNRLIAALARAILIVEAGLPSGTFSTADEALSLGKDVLVVPGAITSPYSHGSNRLLYQGAYPIVDEDSFFDYLSSSFSELYISKKEEEVQDYKSSEIIQAIIAEPVDMDILLEKAIKIYGKEHAYEYMIQIIMEAESKKIIAQYPDGRWGPVF